MMLNLRQPDKEVVIVVHPGLGDLRFIHLPGMNKIEVVFYIVMGLLILAYFSLGFFLG